MGFWGWLVRFVFFSATVRDHMAGKKCLYDARFCCYFQSLNPYFLAIFFFIEIFPITSDQHGNRFTLFENYFIKRENTVTILCFCKQTSQSRRIQTTCCLPANYVKSKLLLVLNSQWLKLLFFAIFSKRFSMKYKH